MTASKGIRIIKYRMTRYAEQPPCRKCGNPARFHSKDKEGKVIRWRNVCWDCMKVVRLPKHRRYIFSKGSICERCSFVPEIIQQLDVNHKDGNHFNNDSKNLETLCANCHRYITFRDGYHNGSNYIIK